MKIINFGVLIPLHRTFTEFVNLRVLDSFHRLLVDKIINKGDGHTWLISTTTKGGHIENLQILNLKSTTPVM